MPITLPTPPSPPERPVAPAAPSLDFTHQPPSASFEPTTDHTFNQPFHSFQQETATPTAPISVHHDDGGSDFWLFTFAFVIVASFFFVKLVLFKSQLFDDNKKATADKLPPPKPAQLPKNDADKGKRFEVRI